MSAVSVLSWREGQDTGDWLTTKFSRERQKGINYGEDIRPRLGCNALFGGILYDVRLSDYEFRWSDMLPELR